MFQLVTDTSERFVIHLVLLLRMSNGVEVRIEFEAVCQAGVGDPIFGGVEGGGVVFYPNIRLILILTDSCIQSNFCKVNPQ